MPTFWSWLGVTMYLTDEAVMETLTIVSRSAPGSTIVFNYNIADHLADPADLALRQVGASGVAASGEPWVNSYVPDDLAAHVKTLGFRSVKIIARRRFLDYFEGRSDGLTWSTLTGAIAAHV